VRGNASEQLEAALVDSMIDGMCEQYDAVEVKRAYRLDEDNVLTVDVILEVRRAPKHITVTAKLL
jgi:hypothetical protein